MSTKWSIREFRRAVVLLALGMSAAQAADAPKDAVAPAGPQSADVDWSNSPAVGSGGGPVLVGGDGAVIFGPASCPILIDGVNIWDLKAGKLTGVQLKGEFERRGLTALSPDGQWFAAALNTPNIPNTAIGIWSTKTGEQVAKIAAGGHESYVDSMAFSSAGKCLLVSGRMGSGIDVYDIESGKKLRTINLGEGDRGSRLAVSDDGRFLATPSRDHLVVYRIDKGEQVAVMRNPPLPTRMRPPGANQGEDDAAPPADAVDDNEALFMFAWCSSLRFSPDGRLLAGLFSHPDNRLVCWDNHGNVVWNQSLHANLFGPQPELEWIPDGSGVVVGGNQLYLHEARNIVFRFPRPFAAQGPSHFIDRDHLLALAGAGMVNNSYQTVTIPWDKINPSVAAMKDAGKRAYLRPGMAVSLRIDQVETQGNAEQVRTALTKAITQRLAEERTPVGANKPVELVVRYQESAVGGGRQLSSRTTLEIRTKDQPDALWRRVLKAESHEGFHRDEETDTTRRESMFQHLMGEMRDLSLPCFIPAEEGLSSLPIMQGQDGGKPGPAARDEPSASASQAKRRKPARSPKK